MKAALFVCAQVVLCFLLFVSTAAYGGGTSAKKKSSDEVSQKSKIVKKSNDAYVFYYVKKGDTLFRIAKDHGISLAELKEANKITDNVVPAGNKLKIPCCSKQSTNNDVQENQKRSRPSDSFDWPVKPVLSVQSDGEKGVKPIGVIIQSSSGSSVRSASSGTVEKIGRMRGYGNFVVIRHANGLVSVYSGLNVISVKEGTIIKKGLTLGYLNNATPELHFMIHRGGKPENPLKLLPEKKG
jgi:lipoprotein YgeR